MSWRWIADEGCGRKLLLKLNLSLTDAYGFAIVLLVNLAVIPLSAERELREFIVVSLEHVSTFAHLLSKTYTLEITEEEVVLRDSLNATIRADFGYLQMKLAETSVELNWTRYSMADYAQMTARIRTMQQVSSHSTSYRIDQHPSVSEFV